MFGKFAAFFWAIFLFAAETASAGHERIINFDSASVIVKDNAEIEINENAVTLKEGKISVKGRVRISFWEYAIEGEESAEYEVNLSWWRAKVNVSYGKANLYQANKMSVLIHECDEVEITSSRIKFNTNCARESLWGQYSRDEDYYAKVVVIEQHRDYIIIPVYVPEWRGYYYVRYYHRNGYSYSDSLYYYGYFDNAEGYGLVWIPYPHFWATVHCYDYGDYFVITHYHQHWSGYHHHYHGIVPPPPRIVKQATLKNTPVKKQKSSLASPEIIPNKEVQKKYKEPSEKEIAIEKKKIDETQKIREFIKESPSEKVKKEIPRDKTKEGVSNKPHNGTPKDKKQLHKDIDIKDKEKANKREKNSKKKIKGKNTKKQNNK